MANATDFIGAVYDTLARSLNIGASSQSEVFQMAWPGYTLSPADFKPANAPNGPYDSDIAKEAFSHVANIAPVLNKLKFENSGFEIDDLYEILISSAIPLAATQDTVTTNPLFHMFSDAQFELMQARRGYKEDPNIFYYPAIATPNNWYDEAAAAFWPTIDLKSSDVKPLPPGTASVFVKSGGPAQFEKGVWKLKPDFANDVSIKKDVQQVLINKNQFIARRIAPQVGSSIVQTKPLNMTISMANKAMTGAPAAATAATGTTAAAAMAIKPAAAINTGMTRTPAYIANLATARASTLFTVKNAPANLYASPAIKSNIQNFNLQKLDFEPAASVKVNLAQRMLIKDLITAQLPDKPASPATTGFSISFKFCRVNIDRPWLKLALLATKNWYMFNTKAREYSTGSVEENPGMFPLLPVSFIVIRDLKITANWSQEDRKNIGQSLAFGPFNLRDASLNQDTVEVKGLQIFGYISKPTPPLPPTEAS